MADGPDIARIAALIGDPARAAILNALMGGHALTASELAREAGVSPQTASGHLSQLHDGGLLALRKQGRHRYFSLAGDEVAALLEALDGLAAGRGHLRTRPGPRDAALRKARVCYNHLAGEFAVQMFDSLVARGAIDLSAGAALTGLNDGVFGDLGVDVAALRAGRPLVVRECLDWSMRRSHLAGSLGRAIMTRLLELGWARRTHGTRLVTFTPEGERRFCQAFPARPVTESACPR